MSEALKLGDEPINRRHSIRRLNRLPIFVVIGLIVLFFAAIIYGLSTRGVTLNSGGGVDASQSTRPASSFADQLKKGVSNGIIGEPVSSSFQPVPVEPPAPEKREREVAPTQRSAASPSENELEPKEQWRARIEREQQEQVLRELHRQRMASIQANEAASDSPIGLSLARLGSGPKVPATRSNVADTNESGSSAMDLYAAAARSRLIGEGSDANGQAAKENFFNQDIKELGYLPNEVVPQRSPYELKRGSVIPATLVTGINSDLPGRIAAQVSQNVYDSATGHHVLIPQGSKLLGRYDAKVSFGQNRVLVIWTDIVFPDGSTLQIDGMPGIDSAGFGGFSDRIDNHYFRTFGSAALVALIGAGTEMIIPQERNAFGRSNGVVDATRRSFAETFGQMAHQTVAKNLNVQPTLTIRPGYRFNVLVERDLVLALEWPE